MYHACVRGVRRMREPVIYAKSTGQNKRNESTVCASEVSRTRKEGSRPDGWLSRWMRCRISRRTGARGKNRIEESRYASSARREPSRMSPL